MDKPQAEASVTAALMQREMWQLLRLALPAIVTSCSTMLMVATDQVMVGHLGREALAAASIGNTWYNIMLYFEIGFCTALDTKASQAFGAGDTHGMHAVLVTALVLCVAAALPMVAGLLVTQQVAAVVFRQPPAIAARAGQFCARLAPGVVPQLLGVQFIKFLQVQNQVLAPAVFSIVAVIVNIALNFLFIRRFGFLGAPLATTLSRLLYCTFSAGLVALSLTYAPPRAAVAASPSSPHATDVEEPLLSASAAGAWDADSGDSAQRQPLDRAASGSAIRDEGQQSSPRQLTAGAGSDSGSRATGGHGVVKQAIDRAVRQGLSRGAVVSYLELAIPGGLMLALEAGSFQVTTALAGMLGVVQVDAHTAMLTVTNFNFLSFPFGIGIAATIRVGNLLGANRPVAARAAGWCAVLLGGVSMAVCAVAIAAARGRLARIFIDDAAVQRAVSAIAPLGASSEVFDGIFGTAQGALRGAGKQVDVMLYNLVGFWGVGVTSGAALTFGARWGLQGLWTGIVLGVFVACVLNVQAVHRLDWEAEAAATAQGAGGEHRGRQGGSGSEAAGSDGQTGGGGEAEGLLEGADPAGCTN